MASGPVSDAVLLDHSQYFDRMLSLIPARLYFPKDAAADEEFAMRKKGFLKVSTEKSSKLAKKEARSQALKEKLNPENFKTVPEIQRQAAQAGASDVSDAKSEESKAEEDESVADQTEKSAEPPRPITAPAQSMEELRVRVQQRIEEMRKKRNAEAHEGSDEKLKRREERKRKRDEKRKARKLAAGDTPKKAGDGAASAPAAADAAELESQEEADASSSDQDIDDIKFGTFDFSAHKPVPSYLSKKKGKMSLQQTLKRVEGEREQMKALEGTEEGQKLKEDMLWDKALKRAKGEKLKDDPKRIKAAIKREHKKKVKSAVEWKERNAAVAKQQAERQEKRQSNIDNKIQKRKDKKMGNKKKSSGGRAGFEGKKRSFLNK